MVNSNTLAYYETNILDRECFILSDNYFIFNFEQKKFYSTGQNEVKLHFSRNTKNV
jgi:hypothetical protein